MRARRSCRPVAVGLLLAARLLGCAAPAPGARNDQAVDAASFAAPTELTATLVDPLNIDLEWKDNATAEAGYFVEGYFVGQDASTGKEFLIIDALPPNTTRYRHAHLLPETKFVFRVRPFFGGASNVVETTTGKQGAQTLGPETPEPLPHGATRKGSLRSPSAPGEAAPTDLKATLIPPAGVKLEWKDHALDEDEYLVEIKPEWGSDFKASVFLDRDTTSMISYDFPLETRFAFRVRAFFYGEPSNVAEQTTGVDPSMSDGTTRPVPSRPSKPKPSRSP